MPLKTHRDEQPSLNLTPMVDVLFNLIIFFMAGTQFTTLERKITLEVPRVSEVKTLTPAPDRRVVNVYADGRIELDREFVTIDELALRLTRARAEYADLGVLVRGDAEGAFQYVATVLAACRQAGIAEMGIAVRLAQKER